MTAPPIETLGHGRYHVHGVSGEYVVQLGPDRVSCTCPGFRYRAYRRAEPCKHITLVTGWLVQMPAEPIGAGPGLEPDIPPPEAA